MLIAMLFGAILITVGQTDYKMWQLTYLKPLPGTDLEAAAKAMAEHNKKFHVKVNMKLLCGLMLRKATWVVLYG